MALDTTLAATPRDRTDRFTPWLKVPFRLAVRNSRAPRRQKRQVPGPDKSPEIPTSIRRLLRTAQG